MSESNGPVPEDEDGPERRTMADMAGDDGFTEELFPLGSIEGDSKTLKNLVKPGQKVEQTVSLMSAEVPISGGGLLDPEREGLLLVTYEAAGYTQVPVREGDRTVGKTVKSWKYRTQLRPIYVERVEGNAGDIEANFVLLSDADEAEAGALLDRLQARLREKLAAGKYPAHT